jgi:polysaccharide biosynthesis transport protein
MHEHDVSTLRDYLRVLRRRKWVVILIALLVPGLTVFLSLQQSARYESSAEVLLDQQDLSSSLTGIENPNVTQDPARFIQTQVDLARVPTVADRVRRATGARLNLLANSSVSGRNDSNILDFTVTTSSPRASKLLATEYARQFTKYKSELDATPFLRARDVVRQRLNELFAAGDTRSSLYRQLQQKDQQLAQAIALRTSNAYLVRPASEATKVRPRPRRSGIVGLGLGLAFGIALAFLWELVDTRVRSATELAHRLGLPLLARIPEPPRRIRRKNRLVMISDAQGVHAEIFRMLRTNLEFANLERDARTIMFTSSVGEEGKSTTLANLGIALARSGKRVVLVDLDLRRPMLHRFFNSQRLPGLTDVALGHAELKDAVGLVLSGQSGDATDRSNGRGVVEGTLEVLQAGALPPDPGEFVGTRSVSEILARLRASADYVLIDAPPLLNIGDAMVLSAKVDAIVIVARLSVVRRPMLEEVHRIIEAAPAPILGVVVTGTEAEEGAYAGYGYYHYQTSSERQRERVS